MESLDNLISQILVEDSQIKEEKKNNSENNLKSLNDQLIYNSNNDLENNNLNNNSLNNFEINSPVNNKLSSYYNLNAKENENEDKKEEEKNENKIEQNAEGGLGEVNQENISNQKNMVLSEMICDDLYNKFNQNNTEPETFNNQNKDLNLEQSIKDDFFGRDRTYSFRPRKNPPYNQSLNQKEIKINEFNIENENPKNDIDSQENKENKEIPENLPVFTETIQAKIENNEEHFIATLADKIKHKNSEENINNINDINNNENNNNIDNNINDINNNIDNINNENNNNNIDIIENNNINKDIDNNKEIDNNIDNNNINKDIDNNKENDNNIDNNNKNDNYEVMNSMERRINLLSIIYSYGAGDNDDMCNLGMSMEITKAKNNNKKEDEKKEICLIFEIQSTGVKHNIKVNQNIKLFELIEKFKKTVKLSSFEKPEFAFNAVFLNQFLNLK
jgi:hypothetical protein